MDTLLQNFVKFVQAVIDVHQKEQGFSSNTQIEVDEGNVYWRIVANNGVQRLVYGFVRKTDGAIFRANSWKIPDKKHVRGYLDNYDNSIIGAYGITYLKTVTQCGSIKNFPPRP